MHVIYPLVEKFSQNLSWHQARIECMSQLIIGLLQIHTVNLSKLANTFIGECESESSYRRIQRFFEFRFEPFGGLDAARGIPTQRVRVVTFGGRRNNHPIHQAPPCDGRGV